MILARFIPYENSCHNIDSEWDLNHFALSQWRVPWMEEPGGLQAMESLRVGYDWVTSLSLFTFMHWRRKWQPTPVLLPGESQGWGAWWAAIYGVAQSQTQLKWFSSSSSSGLDTKSCPTLGTPQTVACQVPLSMGFSRRGYWSGLPFPSPGDLPDPGIEPRSLALQADSLLTELRGKPWWCVYIINVFFFSTSQWGVYIYVLSYIWFFVTPWTIVHQAPLSMGLSKQEYWMGYHFLLKGIFLIQGLNLHLLHLLRWQADSFPLAASGKPPKWYCKN